jgi:hypothetical protein
LSLVLSWTGVDESLFASFLAEDSICSQAMVYSPPEFDLEYRAQAFADLTKLFARVKVQVGSGVGAVTE